MKKTLCFLLAAMFLLLCGCGGEQVQPDTEEYEPSPLEAHLPALENMIAASSLFGSGILYDIDEDGLEEMLVVAAYGSYGEEGIPAHVYGLYDIENGASVAKFDNALLFYEAGGPYGYVSVADYSGRTVIVVHEDNGETGMGAYRTATYTVYDGKTLENVVSITMDYIDNSPSAAAVQSCTLNGETCSRTNYLNVYNAIQPIAKATGLDYDPANGCVPLYDLLVYLQEICYIKEDEAAKLTQSDAEAIAYGEWGEYLEREQGFDWNIFEDKSVIKDGVKYYRYTLRNNSTYGAADWEVADELFINSVTGETLTYLY